VVTDDVTSNVWGTYVSLLKLTNLVFLCSCETMHISYLLLRVSEKCNTSTTEAVIEDFARYSCMHTSVFSLVILSATSSFRICVRDDLRKCI